MTLVPNVIAKSRYTNPEHVISTVGRPLGWHIGANRWAVSA